MAFCNRLKAFGRELSLDIRLTMGVDVAAEAAGIIFVKNLAFQETRARSKIRSKFREFRKHHPNTIGLTRCVAKSMLID
jgi:hypothetical protein